MRNDLNKVLMNDWFLAANRPGLGRITLDGFDETIDRRVKLDCPKEWAQEGDLAAEDRRTNGGSDDPWIESNREKSTGRPMREPDPVALRNDPLGIPVARFFFLGVSFGDGPFVFPVHRSRLDGRSLQEQEIARLRLASSLAERDHLRSVRPSLRGGARTTRASTK